MRTSYTGVGRAALVAVVCVATFPARTPSAQSLGDLARRGEEQRQGTARIYTNDDLSASDLPTAPEADPAALEPAPAEPPPKPTGFVLEEDPTTGLTNMKGTTARGKRDEQYWRKTIGDLRTKVAMLNRDIAGQQAKLDQVQGDSPSAVREREVISGTIARMHKDLALQTEELTRWLTRAGAAKVPQEWLK